MSLSPTGWHLFTVLFVSVQSWRSLNFRHEFFSYTVCFLLSHEVPRGDLLIWAHMRVGPQSYPCFLVWARKFASLLLLLFIPFEHACGGFPLAEPVISSFCSRNFRAGMFAWHYEQCLLLLLPWNGFHLMSTWLVVCSRSAHASISSL